MTVPDHLVFLQTIADRLAVTGNDYSEEERLFQTGIPLVDPFTPSSEAETVERRKRRDAQVRPILLANVSVPSLSIVLPVYGGGAEVLAECLFSVARQSFTIERPADVETIIVEDGVPAGSRSLFAAECVETAIDVLGNMGVDVMCIKLRSNQGRAQARNAGLSNATRSIVLFLDASMVLDPEFITEHLWRHNRIMRNVALVGFKQNLDWSEFIARKDEIIEGRLRPDFHNDLKWSHVLTLEEASTGGFDFGDVHFSPGQNVNYMQISGYLKQISASDTIGYRTLASFFQTGITSVPREAILSVGGFEPQFQLWGLEDTFLGALLLARGYHLIPCPSSVAFNIEVRQEVDPQKGVDLELNRKRYFEFISKTQMTEYTISKFLEQAEHLQGKSEIVRSRGVVPIPSEITQVGDLSTIVSWGWTGSDLQEQIVRLDYITMDGLTDTHAGNPAQWTPIFMDHPESWRLLVTQSRRIVGYWHFVALFPSQFVAAKSGRLLDASISAAEIQAFELPGEYDIYFAGLALDPQFRRTSTVRLLFESLVDVIQSFAEDDIYIREICTNAFTPHGVALCETLCLRRAVRHVDHGVIYCAYLHELMKIPLLRNRAKLRQLYDSRVKSPSS